MNQNLRFTEGNIYHQLILLAFPLLIGNIVQQFYNTADSVIIGRFLGESSFAAAGVAGTVMNLMIFILCGACSGVSILLAQFYGENDLEKMRRETFCALLLGAAMTVFLSLAGVMALPKLLSLISTPEALFEESRIYLQIILIGLGAPFLYNFLSSLLRAAGDTRAALIFLIIAMVLNILLDLLFVGIFHTGIGGAAWATVLSQLFSALCCLVYIFKYYPDMVIRRQDMVWESALIRKTIQFATVTALQQSSLYLGKLFVQGSVNLLGTASIAAYTAAGRIEGVLNSIGTSGSDAISIFSAQNTGGGRHRRSKQGFTCGCLLLTSFGIFLSVLMFAASGACIRLFLADASKETILYGIQYLKVIAWFYPFCFIGSAFVGYFRGTGYVQFPLIGTTFHITVRVIGSWILAPRLMLPGVAWATGLGWFLLMFYQGHCYCRILKSLNNC